LQPSSQNAADQSPIEIEFNGEWFGGRVVKEVDAGMKVVFDDETSTVIRASEWDRRVRHRTTEASEGNEKHTVKPRKRRRTSTATAAAVKNEEDEDDDDASAPQSRRGETGADDDAAFKEAARQLMGGSSSGCEALMASREWRTLLSKRSELLLASRAHL
jgi:hypothetical protein